MKKIAYIVRSPKFARVICAMPKIDNTEQVVFYLNNPKTRAVMSSYKFSLDKFVFFYNSGHDIELINKLKVFQPDIIVQTKFVYVRKWRKYIKGAKFVYLFHGFLGKSDARIHGGQIENKRRIYGGFDLYCCGAEMFKKRIDSVTDSANVVTNALPQLDMLYNYNDAYVSTNIDQKTILLVCSAFVREQDPKEFLSILMKLFGISRRKQYKLIVKTRFNVGLKEIYERIYDNDEPVTREEEQNFSRIDKVMSDENISVVNDGYYIYPLIASADLVIVHGLTSVEVEAALINKPLIVVNNNPNTYDEFGVTRFGACIRCRDADDIEEDVIDHMIFNKDCLAANQRNFAKHLGVTVDGYASARASSAIEKLL